MSKKKGKFDLTRIVHDGYLKDGEKIFFVSDPKVFAEVQKQPNGEFKIKSPEGTTTVHAFATKCLGMEPPDHASRWFRNEKGETLYQLWHAAEDADMAA
jgi:hypothetical protein